MIFKNIWHLLKAAFSDVYRKEDFYHWWTLVNIPPPGLILNCACSMPLQVRPCNLFFFFFPRLLHLKQRRAFSNEIIKSHILIHCVYMDQDIVRILKVTCAGYLQRGTPSMPSGARWCYSSSCIMQSNVSHSHTTAPSLLACSQKEMMLTWESLF